VLNGLVPFVACLVKRGRLDRNKFLIGIRAGSLGFLLTS
jgi:hypothetical protein